MANFYDILRGDDLLRVLPSGPRTYRAFVPFVYESAVLLAYAVDASGNVVDATAIVPPDFDTTPIGDPNAWTATDNGIVRLFRDRGTLRFRIRLLPGSDFYVTDVLVSPVVASYHVLGATDDTNVDVGYRKFHAAAASVAEADELRDMYIALREGTVYRVYQNVTQLMEFTAEGALRHGRPLYLVRRRLNAPWGTGRQDVTVVHPIVHVPLHRPLRLEATDEAVLEVAWPQALLKPGAAAEAANYMVGDVTRYGGRVVLAGFLPSGDAVVDIYETSPTPTRIGRIVIPNGSLTTSFLPSIATNADGTVVVLGNTNTSGGFVADGLPGKVFVFRTTDNWATYTTTVLTSTSTNPGTDQYGWSVAVDAAGDRIVVGAPKEAAGGTKRGAAYLYDGNGNLLAKLTRSPNADNELFGWAVAITRDTSIATPAANQIVISAPYAAPKGVLHVYDGNGTQITTLSMGPSDPDVYFLGDKVAISENTGDPVIAALVNDSLHEMFAAVVFYGAGFASKFFVPWQADMSSLPNGNAPTSRDISISGPHSTLNKSAIIFITGKTNNTPEMATWIFTGSTDTGTWTFQQRINPVTPGPYALASFIDPIDRVSSALGFGDGTVPVRAVAVYRKASGEHEADVYFASNVSNPTWTTVMTLVPGTGTGGSAKGAVSWFYQLVGLQLIGIRAFYEPTAYEDMSLFAHEDLVGSTDAVVAVPSVRLSAAPGEAWVGFIDSLELPDFDALTLDRRAAYTSRDELIVYALPYMTGVTEMSIGGLMLFHAPKRDLSGRLVMDHCLLIPFPSYMAGFVPAWQSTLAGTTFHEVFRHLAYTNGTGTASPADFWVLPIPLRFRRNYQLAVRQVREPSTAGNPYRFQIVGLRRVEP